MRKLQEEELLPPRKTTKRWTIEQLKELLDKCCDHRACPLHAVILPTVEAWEFLDWLEKQCPKARRVKC